MQHAQRAIICFLANRNWNANKIAAALKEDFGQDVYALRTVTGWLVEIRRGRQDLHDFQSSGRPPLDHIDAQILAALEKWPFKSCRSLALRLACDFKTVHNDLVDSFGFRSVDLRSVPHVMTPDLTRRRREGARTMLRVLEAAAEKDWRYFVTADESWFFLQRASRRPRKTASDHSSQERHVHNHLEPQGFRAVESLPDGNTMSRTYFTDNILTKTAGVLSRREKRTITDSDPALRQLFNSQVSGGRKLHGAKWNGKHVTSSVLT
jgi:hypothetical protein